MVGPKNNKTNISLLRPGIYIIHSVKPGSHVYLIKGSGKNLLIDCGIFTSFPILKNRLAEVGLKPRDIELIVLTHEHMDHVGAAAYFSKKAIITAHHSAANKIELQDEFVTLQQHHEWRARQLRVDLWLEDGNYIDTGNYKLRVIHTPGHTSGCICLYEPVERLLFSGDTIFAGGTLSDISPSGNISDYMHSIERLNNLRIDEIYPGHGKISKTPGQDMQNAVKYALSLFQDSKLLFQTIISGKR